MNSPELQRLLEAYPWFDHCEGPKFAELPSNRDRTIGLWLYLEPVFSAFHRVLNNDEVWAIHHGCAHLHLIDPEGNYHLWKLGTRLDRDERPIRSVPVGWWQAAEAEPGSGYAYGANVCAPRFSYEQFELCDRAALLREFPQHREVIHRYTR